MVGDASFEAFFRAEYPAMVRSLTLALGDRAVAEDCAQVGFERAYARWSRVERHDRPGAWVYVVAIRHGWKQSARRDPPAPLQRQAVDMAAGVVGGVWFVEALRSLPQRQREAVVLRHLADLRVDDIAEAQGVTAGTVKASPAPTPTDLIGYCEQGNLEAALAHMRRTGHDPVGLGPPVPLPTLVRAA